MPTRLGTPDDLELALELATIADGITMRHFRSSSLVVSTKADRTEVTIADRGAEESISDALARHRPDDAVLGDEFGERGGRGGRRWIIDPIDGTSNYVRGVPVWATLIALEIDDRLEIGVVSAPALSRRWWAQRGRGSFGNGEPIRVSAVASIEHAFLSFSEGPWENHGMRSGIGALVGAAGRVRAFGDFWQHMLVAEGSIDVAVEPIVSLWDLAAVQVVVEEAGGTFTSLAGVARPDGGSALSTNGLLHEPVLAVLRIGAKG